MGRYCKSVLDEWESQVVMDVEEEETNVISLFLANQETKYFLNKCAKNKAFKSNDL